MIIAKLKGGLGNQLFQYAAGRALAEHLQTELKLDISHYETDIKRHYSLNHFNIKERLCTPEDILGKSIYKEQSFIFDRNFFSITDNTILDGYFQSINYFESIEPIIRKEFTLEKSASRNLTVIQEEITTINNPVSVHVRRGDYVSEPKTNKYHGVLPLSYYQEALIVLKKKIGSFTLCIFSDDPVWAKEHLGTVMPSFVVSSSTLTDYEELLLMSGCKHHIIANSSFSWWGAWLNQTKGKVVIAPKRWFADPAINTSDITPASWIRL